MKKKTYITRFLGLFMFLFVMFHHITPARAMASYTKVEESAKEKNKKSAEEQPTLQQGHNDVVVPSTTFHFDNQVLISPPITFYFSTNETPTTYISKPIYRLSYFKKLFGHHIAVNAP